jgi:hypothetical protein
MSDDRIRRIHLTVCSRLVGRGRGGADRCLNSPVTLIFVWWRSQKAWRPLDTVNQPCIVSLRRCDCARCSSTLSRTGSPAELLHDAPRTADGE